MYRLVRQFLKLALEEFFRSIRVSGEKPIENGPLLLVSNHPNCFLDSVIIACFYPRTLWFVAKSTVFGGAVRSWFLRFCHLIPVYRKQDNPEDSSKNELTFARVIEKLGEKSEAILIFPEGISLGERKIQPLKTGAARMAFLTELKNNWSAKVLIQPVGLTYTELVSFKSSITLKIGKAIDVSKYRSQYEQDSIAAVEALTQEVESALNAISVSIAIPEVQELVEKIAVLYESAGIGQDDETRLRTVAKEVEARASKDDSLRVRVQKRVDQYHKLLSVFQLENSSSLNRSKSWLFLLLNSPFILLGALTHYIPYRVIGSVIGSSKLHPATLASYKFAAGLILFPLLYLISAILIYLYAGFNVSLMSLLVLLWSGHSVNLYFSDFRLLILSIIWPSKRKPIEVLKNLRDDLVHEFEEIRNANPLN